MRQLTKDEIRVERDVLYYDIENGAVFIHPTDTIYGIGCNAEDYEAVKKVREIKERLTRPFSVIAPSIEWIKKNCIINGKASKWLQKLPGPYTLILKLKNKDAVAPNVNLDTDTLGVRIPDHWIKDIVKEIGMPIVTTSANIVAKDYMTSLDDLDESIAKNIDFAIYEGDIKGKPSMIIDLSQEEEMVIER